MSRERNVMTITVAVLAIAILTILTAYFAFSNDDVAGEESYAHAGSLRMVAMIFRHGQRLPTELYPNDPHKSYQWPGAFGSLTPVGSRQMYNLGQTLKKRYKHLLPSNGIYSTNDMYVLSSAAERCLMSAQAFLASFLVPNESILPIAWQPVAVNSLPRDRDNLIAQKMACPKYDKLLKEYYDSPHGDILEVNQQNRELFKLLTEKTGLNITSVASIERIYNTLDIEQSMGLALPDWTHDIFPDKLQPLAERNLALLTVTPYMMKVKGGSLITEIVNKLSLKVADGLSPNRTTLIYSGHDVTLVNVMRALNISDQTSRKPDYAATLAFELHQGLVEDRPHEYSLKIFYYENSSVKTPIDIRFPACKSLCLFEDFTAAVQSVILHDYNESCKL